MVVEVDVDIEVLVVVTVWDSAVLVCGLMGKGWDDFTVVAVALLVEVPVIVVVTVTPVVVTVDVEVTETVDVDVFVLVTGGKMLVVVVVDVLTLRQEHAALRRVAGVFEVLHAGGDTVAAARFFLEATVTVLVTVIVVLE